ncbi:MAG: hypothetical protein SPF69_04380 [Candidatus Ornithospirochaeta sp.]|nr:hypothetical protein [Sphaerochaetaceae bacterium]MDY5523307.1 hypothetical protein [Candidatus Ornithospirochaeta sp.]
MIRDSKALLEATWKRDEKAVAEAVARAHAEACSIQRYNNKGSFQSALVWLTTTQSPATP